MGRKKIIVVGGGASGLMAAGTASGCGADVLLLEKMKTPARKIRISGKGRCNVSNSAELSDFLSHFGKSGQFLRQPFSQFFTPELVAFFESRGLKLRVERGGRIFPADGDAPVVAKLLVQWAEEAGVTLRSNVAVDHLIIRDNVVGGVISNNQNLYCDSVIVAAGGASYPRTGSTGDGYRLAGEAGHTIIPIRPALVPLETAKAAVKGLAGLDLRNINLRLFIDGKRKRQIFGELSFTGFGLGGPIVLSISQMAVDALRRNQKVSVSLDLKPALDEAKLDARLLRDLQKRSAEPMVSVLRGLLPRQLVDTCLDHTNINPDFIAGNLPASARKAVRNWLKNFRFDITGCRPIEEAIVTAGGVKTAEINPHTMESKMTKNLYLVGELLDIQGDTGGYNLQAAFSTGWVAGHAAGGGSPHG